MAVLNINSEIDKLEKEIEEKYHVLNYLKNLGSIDNSIVFSDWDKDMIVKLWNKGTVGFKCQLVTRDKLGSTNNTNLCNLYDKLLKKGYIYKKVGYFSSIKWEHLVENENIKITSKD